MKKGKSLLKIMGMMLSLSLMVTACGKGNNENANSTPTSDNTSKAVEETKELDKVRVAYMPNMGSASALIAARDYGLFEKYGIDVELTRFSNGPDEIAAMGSGDIDISQIGHGAHKLAIEGQAVIFQLDSTSLADEVIGNASRGVKTLADLKGKKIASTMGTSADIILKLALEDAGLTEDDVEIVEMDASGVVPSMVSGQIDAVATWSPGTVTIKEQLGDDAVMLANNETYIDKATFPSSFITTNKYVEENRDVLVRFAAAIQEAQDLRIEKLDDVAKAVAKETELDEETMLNSKNEGNWETSGATFLKDALKDGTVKKYYENQQKTFLDAGAIKEEVPVEDYVLFDIMQEANDLATK
ncbi:MAG: aliphatic sulfonate ABC transporter substrate-binding protein [Tissierellia bacterium]|nr:aliphatic sulfonate ABC transporter substrate-binding protein [Tissierellia bacterium]